MFGSFLKRFGFGGSRQPSGALGTIGDAAPAAIGPAQQGFGGTPMLDKLRPKNQDYKY